MGCVSCTMFGNIFKTQLAPNLGWGSNPNLGKSRIAIHALHTVGPQLCCMAAPCMDWVGTQSKSR